jgi:hypothetical protein
VTLKALDPLLSMLEIPRHCPIMRHNSQSICLSSGIVACEFKDINLDFSHLLFILILIMAIASESDLSQSFNLDLLRPY